MGKVLAKSIEYTVDEHEKEHIASGIRNYLIKEYNEDWSNGSIRIDTSRFETVEVIFFDGCKHTDELIEFMSF